MAVAPDAETREVRAPFTGEILYHLPLATEYDVASAAARARSVQREWAERPVRDRVRIMRRFHNLVIAKRDEALDLLQWEVGKRAPMPLRKSSMSRWSRSTTHARHLVC